jgi:hypothetical protein
MEPDRHMPTARERQALEEIGRTDLARGTGPFLAAAFFLTLVAGAVADLVPPGTLPDEPFAAGVVQVRELVAAGEPLAANRALLAAMNDFEDDLERGSRLTTALQPWAQRFLTGTVGAGTEQVYPGRDGWLFFRPDVDYATGWPFLEPRTLTRRSRGGFAWEAAPHPDPLPAIRELRDALAARGIALVLLPTPVKPVVHPERLSRRYAPGSGPLQNASFDELRRRVEAAGVLWVDPAPLLAAAAATEPQFLRTDTHWTPGAMDATARQLAAAIRPLLSARESTGWRRVPLEVDGEGDIEAMLRLPPRHDLYPPERVEVQRVLAPGGRGWAPDRRAEVLLLGDSFTNVYSVPALGWGAGAGLAEQLGFHLARGVDRIAVNDDGAWATRERLAADLARGVDRLAGKRVVVWQLAVRELSGGDWRPVPLPPE